MCLPTTPTPSHTTINISRYLAYTCILHVIHVHILTHSRISVTTGIIYAAHHVLPLHTQRLTRIHTTVLDYSHVQFALPPTTNTIIFPFFPSSITTQVAVSMSPPNSYIKSTCSPFIPINSTVNIGS